MKTHWTQHFRGRIKPRGTMNKTEAAYAAHLEGRKMLGEVLWFAFKGITFKLGEGCRYTPDFVVMTRTGMLECHETKGFWADDAKVKIKLAAEKFPFRFVAVKPRAKKNGGGWEETEF